MTVLTPLQREILRLIREAAAAGARIHYRTEWLGWLPYGQYDGVDVERAGDRPVPLELPDGSELRDLLALEAAGHLRRVRETHEPGDDVHEVIYTIAEAG